MENPQEIDDQVPTTKDNTESIDMLFEEIEFLKKENVAIKADNAAMKASLEECKQLIMLMKNIVPTLPQQTHTPAHNITIQQAPAPEKPVDETCNPRFIEKSFNDNPKYDNTPHIEAFFSIKQEHVMFDFDEVENLEAIANRGHEFVYNHIAKFITKKISDGVEVPFVFHKSAWYLKRAQGWERQTKPNNKNKDIGHPDYKYEEPGSSFLFIIKNRLIAHCWDVFGDNCLMTHEGARILSEVLDINKYHSRDIQRVILDALDTA